jgi:hypothetical protein
MLMTLGQYARHRKCHLKAVQYAIQRGRITREANGLINSERADLEWDQNTNHAQARYGPKYHSMRSDVAANQPGAVTREPEIPAATVPAAQSPIALTFAQARSAREVFEARLKKVELEERQGSLLSKRSVQIEAFNRARILRDAILNVPDRVAAQLAAESETSVVRDPLETELVLVLKEYSGANSG